MKIKKKQRRLIFYGFCLIFIAIIIIQLKNSAIFKINNIFIKGINHFSNRQILGLTKIPERATIFNLDNEKLKNNLLKNKWIKKVEIEKKFPNSLILKINERNPIAFLTISKKFILIDEQGYILDKTNNYKYDLPFLSGIKYSLIKINNLEKLILPKYISQLFNSLRLNAQLLAKISEINFKNNGTIVIYLEDDFKIYLNGINIKEKINILNFLVQDKQIENNSNKIEYIDMKNEKFVIKWK